MSYAFRIITRFIPSLGVSSSDDPEVQRLITLPFPPFLGLTLLLPGDDGEILLENDPREQRQLCWDSEAGEFVFYRTDRSLRRQNDPRAYLQATYLDAGWTVTEWGFLEPDPDA